ncbi:hypothetical protein [Vibrio nereis]|uniref:hypothetical protein n=1 Tax=Vibrio nereis TaxID=693 RepID=UPI002494D7CD|nr:hypothetical protein [Vibrio nereis]
MNNQDSEYWQYGEKWDKAFPLRLPPAKQRRTFFILTAILFSLWSSSVVLLYDIFTDILPARTDVGRGVSVEELCFFLFLQSYFVWIWRYTAPLSVWRYKKDQYNRPTLSSKQQWVASLITLILCVAFVIIDYYLLLHF